jgi:hypothetical protein
MKVVWRRRFPWHEQAWCDVDVYRLGLHVLVVFDPKRPYGHAR